MSQDKEAGPAWLCMAVSEVKGSIDAELPVWDPDTSIKNFVWLARGPSHLACLASPTS